MDTTTKIQIAVITTETICALLIIFAIIIFIKRGIPIIKHYKKQESKEKGGK